MHIINSTNCEYCGVANIYGFKPFTCTNCKKENCISIANFFNKESKNKHQIYNKSCNLYYLVGNCRSGKSIFADQWQSQGQKRVVLSGDAFRKGVHGQIYIGEAEFFVFACLDATARALISEGYTVLIDETNTTTASLERIYRISIDAQPIFINTSTEVCIERAKKLGQNYLLPAIKRIGKQLEELKENFEKKIENIKHRVIERRKVDYIASVEPKGF